MCVRSTNKLGEEGQAHDTMSLSICDNKIGD